MPCTFSRGHFHAVHNVAITYDLQELRIQSPAIRSDPTAHSERAMGIINVRPSVQAVESTLGLMQMKEGDGLQSAHMPPQCNGPSSCSRHFLGKPLRGKALQCACALMMSPDMFAFGFARPIFGKVIRADALCDGWRQWRRSHRISHLTTAAPPHCTSLVATPDVNMEMEIIEDSSYSQISCGPGSMAPKVLVGIVDVTDVNGKTTYVIRSVLSTSNMEWMVQRRYSEFLELRDDLLAFFTRRMVQQCFGCRWFFQSLNGFDFPRRHLLNSRDPDVIAQRKSSLDQFARLLASHTFSAIPKCISCSKLPFARVRDFFLKNATIPPLLNFKIIYNALSPEHFSAIADPKKSKIEFRRGHGIVKMLQVEKPVHSKRASQEQAFREQVKQDQQKALQRKMSFHKPGHCAPTTQSKRHEEPQNATTIVHIEVINASDDDDEAVSGDDGELDMTGVEIDISTDGSARRLAPLQRQSTENLWQPWEFASPTKAKST